MVLFYLCFSLNTAFPYLSCEWVVQLRCRQTGAPVVNRRRDGGEQLWKRLQTVGRIDN